MNKRLLFVFFMIITIGILVNAEITLETSKTKDINKVYNSEGSYEKTAIPNWKKSSADGDKLRKKKPIMEGARKIKLLKFNEDSNNVGYPIGWMTNSDIPILLQKEAGNYIELDENLTDVYLGKYITVKPNTQYNLHLTFENLAYIELLIYYYNGSNEKQLTNKNQKIPVGKFDDYVIVIHTDSDTNRLFIKFMKATNDKFILTHFKIEEVER